MRSAHLIPIAVLAVAVACTENASNPAESNQPQLGQGGTPGSPSYKSSSFSAASLAAGGALSHSWRQTGLGSFTTVPYLLSAQFTATAHCENGGGNTVNGNPFQISGSATTGPRPQTPRNGAIDGFLELSVGPVDCQPPGGNKHAAVIDAVTWTQITFCWGAAGSTATDLQGPTPGGRGVDTPLSAGTSAAGSPTDGSAAASSGIFATPCTF
jgi:hypothetical protein